MVMNPAAPIGIYFSQYQSTGLRGPGLLRDTYQNGSSKFNNDNQRCRCLSLAQYDQGGPGDVANQPALAARTGVEAVTITYAAGPFALPDGLTVVA
jgi:hypothetical protein